MGRCVWKVCVEGVCMQRRLSEMRHRKGCECSMAAGECKAA